MADQPTDRYPDSEGPFAGPNNTFPMNTAARVRNAWARIHQDPTMMNHTAAEITAIKGKIAARAKELGVELDEQNMAAARSLDDGDTIERRAVLMPVELRALPDSPAGNRMIGGYAAVFSRESRLIPRMSGGTFIEMLVPTFFNEARTAGWPGNQGSGVLCRYNHNDQYLLGTTNARTCELSVDRTGLEYRAEVPQCRNDVLELVGRGDVTQSSFTFMHAQDDWNYTGGVARRTLLSGGVLDVAPVSAVCAYQDTTVGMRSLAAFKDVPVDDVYALARADDLRKLFVRTDQQVPVGEGRAIEPNQTPAADPVAPPTDPAPEPTPEPVAEAAAPPESPEPPAAPAEPQAPEQPNTISWQEAHLYLLSRRPFDPIVVK